ncbi:unnamed protein product [Symbiodinium natans]|uniref:Uncharacterized protein n=1 Tax=Symbiodinium natans TaxID=878477 RepID=A0A812K2T0_9DINO|nr:unnamed protein product [Symbiodinium natans]
MSLCDVFFQQVCCCRKVSAACAGNIVAEEEPLLGAAQEPEGPLLMMAEGEMQVAGIVPEDEQGDRCCDMPSHAAREIETGDASDGATPADQEMEGGNEGDGCDSVAATPLAEGGGTGESCPVDEIPQRGETGDVSDSTAHPQELVLAAIGEAGDCAAGAEGFAHLKAEASECRNQGVSETSRMSETDKKSDEPAPRVDLPALSKSALGAAQTPPPPPPVRERVLRFVFTRLGLAP